MYIKGALRSCWAVRTSDPLRRRGFVLTVSGRNGLPMPWSSRSGSGVLPVQGIGMGQQLQSGQREPIAPSQGLLPVALAGPVVLGGEHQHQGHAIPQPQQVSGGQEVARVCATAIHDGEHRAQAAGEADPAPPAEHPGVSAQGIPEEFLGAGRIETLAVRGVRFTLAIGEVVVLAADAIRGSEQGPAVGSDLQQDSQCREGGVLAPGGCRGYRLLPARVRQGVQSCVAE